MKPCFECGRPSDHNHHVVPESLGGTKTVPLCARCHGLVHDRTFLTHRTLTKQGLARARASGTRLGRPPVLDSRIAQRCQRLRDGGLSFQAIADELNRDRVPTAHGGQKWYPSTIRAVLTSVRQSA